MSNQQSNPRPIPRGEHAMSFSAAINSPAAYTLTYFLNNTRPQDLHANLLRAVTNNMMLSQHVDGLLISLQCAGIVTAATFAASADTTQRHCVRCHKGYLERDNGRLACVVLRSKPTLQKSDQSINGQTTYRNHFPCCNVYTHPSMPIQPYFVGRHTTVAFNVSYNAINIRQCHEAGCCGQQQVAMSASTSASGGLRPIEAAPSIDMMQT